MAHSEKNVKFMDREHMTWKKNLVRVSCLGFEAIGCGFIKQINDSLYDVLGRGFCTWIKQEYCLP